MITNATLTLDQLDGLCHALEDYLAITLDEHTKLHNTITTEFHSIRARLMSTYAPIEARIWAIKASTNIPIEIA